jgi:hypothetical protein
MVNIMSLHFYRGSVRVIEGCDGEAGHRSFRAALILGATGNPTGGCCWCSKAAVRRLVEAGKRGGEEIDGCRCLSLENIKLTVIIKVEPSFSLLEMLSYSRV